MNNCIVCGAELLSKPLVVCHDMPGGAQCFLAKEEIAKEQGKTLDLRQCSGCGLVQFDCPPVEYYRDVIRAGGISSTMRELRTTQYKHFIERCNLVGKKIIEIGCGQGEFLQILTDFPVRPFGIEHKRSLVESAKKRGLNVWEKFTETEDTVLEGGPFDAFLSFNVLEHQPFPNKMLRCIYNNLTPSGVGLITVPSFEYILKSNSYYELLRDHIANYTKETLSFLIQKNGFDILDFSIVNRDTLSVIVQKRHPIDVTDFESNFCSIKKQLAEYFGLFSKKVAVWGASHQSLTIISTADIGKHIAYIIDSASFKQGKYAPVSHIPVVSPDFIRTHPVESILILAPGYIDEIREQIENNYGKNIKIAALDGNKLIYLNF